MWSLGFEGLSDAHQYDRLHLPESLATSKYRELELDYSEQYSLE